VQHANVNIAVAVALESGLITPVVADCDKRSLGSLSREAKRVVAAARDNKLAAADLQGGTFTVSNLGMYGIVDFTSIINPPQAAILSVGATQRLPMFEGDSDVIVAKQIMRVTLAADHRVTDGAEVARFLNEIKRLLESPLALLVG
jgi:pyruvate dehydrogenase E2 component (dihydrolipoamide acetyltransferase)